MRAARQHYDAIIVGGGHNGLTAAAYLARAGLTTLLLERRDELGGAAMSTRPFRGVDIKLSRYSYLVSLLPDQIVADLALDLELRSRPTASYSPLTDEQAAVGLLVERTPGSATAASFAALTGDDREYRQWQEFYAAWEQVAGILAPTMLAPLPRAATIREALEPVRFADRSAWSALTEQPIGSLIERTFTHDLVRGAVATDALIGTFADLEDTSLIQNRCFLYHLIGNGSGEWRVPVGGMGAVTGALARAAVEAGTEIHCGAGVQTITPGEDHQEVRWHDGDTLQFATADVVLSNTAPWVLDILLGQPHDRERKPRGAQLKINLALSRLPRLRSGIDPDVAFAGTLHLNEGYQNLGRAYREAAAGQLPSALPGEVYCHTLTDPSILGDSPPGTHTLTYFGLHLPTELFEGPDAAEVKATAVASALASLQEHLAEPLEACILRDEAGQPCIEAKTPPELEAELALPGGHIFHGDLAWPWAADRESMTTPARAWGVDTDHPGILLCGSGSRRGGAVSGIGGHNAAQAVLAGR